MGLKLLGLFKRLSILEQDFAAEMNSLIEPLRISLAISRDSLETWFRSVFNQLNAIPRFTLDIIADDQERTLSYLESGLVAACASTTAKPLSGCKVAFLGYFDYVLVASPEFKRRYFKNGKNVKRNLLEAPAIMFDTKDNLHTKYLAHFFNLDDKDIHYHVVPSVAGFRQFTLNGYAYALIPHIDIMHELKQKKLINLFPDKIWEMPIYWHSWAIEANSYKIFNELVIKIAKSILRQIK